jgi:hypothetical protein
MDEASILTLILSSIDQERKGSDGLGFFTDGDSSPASLFPKERRLR